MPSLRVRMDPELERAILKAAKRSGLTRDEYIRHVLRIGLGLIRCI